ncbi:hypothetical protein [Robertmurraya siralis]|uniref:hypothetical protein n=1 Tax=Robertmurraya siralis TaxID=77777 RepID=UPI00147702C8|nr:hypothetical protein [Robertmurraya siralis]
MKGIVTENCCLILNDYDYRKGDIVEITELNEFKDHYAIYYEDKLDWIPKKKVKLLVKR